MRPKKQNYPIAVLCSDLHLTLKCPACRLDKDWMQTQAGYLQQLRDLQEPPMMPDGKQSRFRLPVLCAGDIFDRWNPPPELIRFALEHLPDEMISVPGQHDLPNHRMDEMHRSAYGVLTKAGKIICASTHRRQNVPARAHIILAGGSICLWGFGWDEEIEPPIFRCDRHNPTIALALVHKFIWTVGTGYPGAPESHHLGKFMGQLKGYKVAVIGDNHKPFTKKLKTGTLVFNCGGFIRRKSDELQRSPRVGLLLEDGSIRDVLLNTKGDRFSKKQEPSEELELSMRSFLETLENLGEHGLDFREAVLNHLQSNKNIAGTVRQMVLDSLEQ